MLETPSARVPLIDFQPFGRAFREDPHAYYPALLANSPAAIELEGKPAVVIASYPQVRAVLTDFKLFSSVKPAGTPNMERVDFFNGFPVMNYCDPPQHTLLRRLVGPAFSAGSLRILKARSQKIVDELLAGLGEHPSFDGVADLGYPFARRLLMNTFMGVPPDEEYIFLKYLETIPLLDAIPPGGGKPQAFLDAWKAGTDYCQIALERARRDKTDNLVRLIADASDGGRISQDEIMATMVVLFAGGLTTVSATIGAALLNLARYPEVAERIRQDPELAERHFEETLRLNPALVSVMRFPTQDITFEGLEIKRNTPLYVMLATACYDPAAFPDPYRFDLDRPNNKEHMGFGAGVHTCIGNVIARAVAPSLIADVARRYPGLRMSDPDQKLEYDVANPRVRHLIGVRLAA
jgi:cytochrome P450